MHNFSPYHLCDVGAPNEPSIWSEHVRPTDGMLLMQCEIRNEHGKQYSPNMWDAQNMSHKWVGVTCEVYQKIGFNWVASINT